MSPKTLAERQTAGSPVQLEGTSIEYRLKNARTAFLMELTGGRSEIFVLEPLVDMEYVIHPPVLEPNGDVNIPLEILRFENAAESAVLWPGETIIVKGGIRTHPQAKPILGTVYIPAGKTIDQGVMSRQVLYSRFWTPIGELTMREPVHMAGLVTTVDPSLKSQQVSDHPIPLYNPAGDHVATIYNCKAEV